MRKFLILSFAALMLASTQVFAEDPSTNEYKGQAAQQIMADFADIESFDNVFNYVDDYSNRIGFAKTNEEIDAIVKEAHELASNIKKAMNEELGGMKEGSQDPHPAIQVTKGDKIITLHNPDKVTYVKTISL